MSFLRRPLNHRLLPPLNCPCRVSWGQGSADRIAIQDHLAFSGVANAVQQHHPDQKEDNHAGFCRCSTSVPSCSFVHKRANRLVPTAPRLEFFHLILEQFSKPGLPNPPCPGAWRRSGLHGPPRPPADPDISYVGLDSSTVFFDNAKKKIGDLLPHVTLTQADLMDQACARSLPEQPAAIISTWALHGSPGNGV